jgi:outer membrane lipoprotein-sorting protein
VISNFSDDPTSFSLERYIFDYPSLCNVQSIPNVKNKDEIIELVPKDNNIDFKSAKIWKNPENMISRMEIVDLADVKYAFQLSAIKVDQDIPDTKFNFVPPKGIKIIDLR